VPSVLDQATTIKTRPRTWNICLYGEPGIGKTVLACRAPGALELECEKGAAMSLMNHPELQDIPVIAIRDDSAKLLSLALELRKGAHPEYQTIIIDTLSEFQSLQLAEVWHAERDKGKRPEGHPYQQDYKVNTEYLREVILTFCDLERNVIFVAHETEEKNELTGNSITRPMFTPKLASTMYAYTDAMLYMQMEVNPLKNEQKRIMRAAPTRSIKAKDRMGLPSTFPADQLWELIH
jgi:phage nucleotide-binding protein